MPETVQPLVLETSVTTGTGNLTLANLDGWRGFAGAFGTGSSNGFFYYIRHASAAEWEYGTGYMSDSTTLVRDSVISSSNSNAAVDFSAGTKGVSTDLPTPAADIVAFLAAANNAAAQAALEVIGQGVHTVMIPATSFVSNETNGAEYEAVETTTNDNMVAGFLFDSATDEFVQILIPTPSSWNGGTITVRFYWRTAAASGNVIWSAAAVSIGDNTADDVAFGTAASVTDGSNGTGKINISDFTTAITPAGTPAGGQLLNVRVSRDANNGSDTLAGDAKLLAVALNFTINAVTD